MRLFDYIQQGGPVMYILVILNIVGFTLLLWKIFVVLDARKNALTTLSSMKDSMKSVIASTDPAVAINVLKDEVQMSVHKLETGLNTIKIIASIAPLLGLLGTVMGILSAFKVISSSGLSDPSLFAGGIAMALLTTVGGLIVAIPHFVGYNYLAGALDDYEIELEKNLVKEVFGK